MKKTLLVSLLIAVLICIFAITVSAETVIPDWTETQTIPSIAFKEGFDTTSRVLLSNGDGTYTTYPTNYIIVGSDTKFSVSKELNFAALNEATGKGYTYASVIRLEVPSGFVSFEDRALRSDKGFTAMLTCKIPEGVTTFGAYMIYKNTVLLEIELPNSLTSLGQEFGRDATALRKATVGSSTEINDMAFYGCKALTDVSLAEGITKIGARAFHTTTSLTEISIPSTVTSIGDYAFFNSAITSVTVPNATLGTGVFENCKSLENAVVLGNKISDRTFIGCANLQTLAFSDKVETITGDPLNGTKSTLLTIYTGSDASKLGTLYNNSRFTKADQITYDQYKIDLANGVTYTKATIVYNANVCDALYNGVHIYTDPTSCVAVCTKCSLAKNPDISDHKLITTYTYENGFVSVGEKFTKCTVEGCKYSETTELEAIISLTGYSNKIGGDKMCVGYAINPKAYKEYTEAGYTLSYGIVAYLPTEGETNIAPVNTDLTGKNDKTIVAKVNATYVGFDFILTGFTSEYDGLSLVLCAYVFDGEKVEYVSISNDELTQTQYAQTVTYKFYE